MSAHIYYDGEGRKGGNNVASLLWKELIRKGIIPHENQADTEPVKEINMVFDNCGGQNKNRMVLRMLTILVKKKITLLARAIFLVRGHTKNDCDRLFNLFKINYRQVNCYVPHDLERVLDNHESISVVRVQVRTDEEEGDFRNWDAFQEPRMKRPVNIKKNHVFEVHASKSDELITRESDEAVPGSQVLVRSGGWDWSGLANEESAPGLPDIKWRELYDKWRPLVPECKWAEFKYFANDPGVERRNNVRTELGMTKEQRKQRKRTVSTA